MYLNSFFHDLTEFSIQFVFKALTENKSHHFYIFIENTLPFVPKNPIDYKSALLVVMAWWLTWKLKHHANNR